MYREYGFVDDVWFIENIIKNKYPMYKTLECIDDKIYKRKQDSKMWGAFQALTKCSENMLKDPLDVLEELENEYQIESLFSKQKINKVHYDYASQAVKEIKEELIKRRG